MTAPRPQPGTLADWLHWQENLHPRRMDMGLERVGEVADQLGLRPFPARVVTVGGTNGKGSCALLLETLLRPGERVATYTSPHLQRYTERIRVDGVEVGEAELCRACAEVEAARGDIPLTYFEFGTLAALRVFHDAGVDTAILEVGLGGRLDATNILHPDVAVITSIGLDHVEWLGHNRETIGREKAGIFRAATPAVVAEREPPNSIVAAARECGAHLHLIGRDFDVEAQSVGGWRWRDWRDGRHPVTGVTGALRENLAAALAALTALGEPLDADRIDARLAGFAAPGRRQVSQADGVELIFDVGHNAEAAAVFADWLGRRPRPRQTHAVVGMLVGKPVEPLAAALAPHVDTWYAGGLDHTDRGLGGRALAARMPWGTADYPDVAAALDAARARAAPGDRILVCGSFYTVGAAMDALERHGAAA